MTVATQTLSPLAYLFHERQSEIRSDYLDGQVYQMAGASLSHNRLVGKLYTRLSNHLEQQGGDCEVLPSDMRVRIEDSYMYPDIVVVCGEPEIEDNDILLNPAIVIEVLSPSTEAYDRGKKSKKFRTIESLKEYALVSQDSPSIEHYIRQPNNQWLLTESSGLDKTTTFPSIHCTLELSDIYRRIKFE
ncbi:MAG: Uma2 family endonuclease [Chloroflexota bacterium]